jgi:alkaline phosphatase
VQVRIAAEGPHAGNVIGVTDQTDLFRLMLRALMPPRQPPSARRH